MICEKPNCAVKKTEEPVVTCWLCHSSYHAKCVELAARTADNLREDKGLRWCYLTALTEKFAKYKTVFENASCLEKFLQSPIDSLRKRKKPSNNINTEVVSNLNTNSDTNLAPYQLFSPQMQPNLSIPILSQTSNPSTSNAAISQISNLTVSNASLNTTTPSTSNRFRTPLTSPLPNIPPKPLQVVPSKKTVFAAKFAAETTIEDISFYIKSKLQADIELSVFKFKYRERRSKASFKIIVPEDIFDRVVNPEFWPQNALIKEYIYKESPITDIVYLPNSSQNVPKN
ncbi:uncharacterized protein LOC142240068 [Haematobia irritans]|uniref:uncharacterized protein LOC142225217 n=1 Tax=Haematobia irritans TaxID=7368 RepID=UPI003F50A991